MHSKDGVWEIMHHPAYYGALAKQMRIWFIAKLLN